MTKPSASAATRRATAQTPVAAGLTASELAQTVNAGSADGLTAGAATATQPIRQATTVLGLVDAVAALAQGSLANALYLFDNNQMGGSGGQGSGSLRTKIAEGDVVVLVSMPLESEVFVRIDDVLIEQRFAEYVRLNCGAYPQTAVVYWTVEVVKTPPEPIPYQLTFRLGSRAEPMPADAVSFLVPHAGQALETQTPAAKPADADAPAATVPAAAPVAEPVQEGAAK
ncbi:MAG TPA: hypothetical protein PKZ97_11955 [Azospirillaceae bacterium]|nr:hypothetical protein [Azospirillaceae bacterium]HRQ81821.1 hypothetical protein [Azospirillaceae bacterium]